VGSLGWKTTLALYEAAEREDEDPRENSFYTMCCRIINNAKRDKQYKARKFWRNGRRCRIFTEHSLGMSKVAFFILLCYWKTGNELVYSERNVINI